MDFVFDLQRFATGIDFSLNEKQYVDLGTDLADVDAGTKTRVPANELTEWHYYLAYDGANGKYLGVQRAINPSFPQTEDYNANITIDASTFASGTLNLVDTMTFKAVLTNVRNNVIVANVTSDDSINGVTFAFNRSSGQVKATETSAYLYSGIMFLNSGEANKAVKINDGTGATADLTLNHTGTGNFAAVSADGGTVSVSNLAIGASLDVPANGVTVTTTNTDVHAGISQFTVNGKTYTAGAEGNALTFATVSKNVGDAPVLYNGTYMGK